MKLKKFKAADGTYAESCLNANNINLYIALRESDYQRYLLSPLAVLAQATDLLVPFLGNVKFNLGELIKNKTINLTIIDNATRATGVISLEYISSLKKFSQVTKF